jgi:6-phosphofructokinase
VGIVVSGGIAPGINSVIAGIVDRHKLYWHAYLTRHPERAPELQIYGYRDGFVGLSRGTYRLISFRSVVDAQSRDNADLRFVSERANEGGSMFGTSRYDALTDSRDPDERKSQIEGLLQRIWNDEIDILYIIGGDGSMKAAHALHTYNKRARADAVRAQRPFSVVAIPKTMDNDILWVWQSFGFLSAVQKAEECLRQLYTEANSNPRLCIIQLFGSDSGFVVSHTALAGVLCDAALIPEIQFGMGKLFEHIRSRLEPRLESAPKSASPFGVIVMAETAVPIDWAEYIDWRKYFAPNESKKETREQAEERRAKVIGELSQLAESLETTQGAPEADHDQGLLKEVKGIEEFINRELPDGAILVDLESSEIEAMLDFIIRKRRVYGQTPDSLRTGGLKLVSRVLQEKIRTELGTDDEGDRHYWEGFRVFTNEPRHLLRANPPSTNDIIVGQRFGTLAVDNALAGCTDFMISQWLTEYVLVPLELVVLGRKRVPRTGIFWKSVLAKTGQPENMAD